MKDESEVRGFAESEALRAALEERARKQAAVAQLGLRALTCTDLDEVFRDAVETAAATLGADYAKVLELLPDRSALLLRAGVGWKAGIVGRATVPTDTNSQAGYTLAAAGPVIVEDLAAETRFRGPELLTDHGVTSGMSVIIQGRRRPWGVFGVHHRARRAFTADDVNFLQSVANVVTAAIERERMERELLHHQRELALKTAQERLRRAERLASLGTFAAGIAHEINNPINSILMTAETAQMALRDGRGERLERALDVVVNEAERCGRVVRAVLDFARPRPSEIEVTDLNRVVTAAVGMARKLLKSKRASFTLDLERDLPPVRVDAAEIEQALIYLFENSLDAVEEEVSIEVATRRLGDGRLAVVVGDDGPGVPAEVRARVFDPFFSTRRESGGTGLGLSMVHSIVQEHGGSVDLAESPAGGARFELVLPAAADDASEG